MKVKLLSRVRLFATLWTIAHQAPLSMGFSRKEYWSGLPFPSPGDLPNPGIETRSPALQADALTFELPGKHPQNAYKMAGSLDPQGIMESSPQTHADPKLELLQGQAKIMFSVGLILQSQGMCSQVYMICYSLGRTLQTEQISNMY